MQVILFLIIISLLVAGGFLVAFFWAVGDGQYDDSETPAMRILVDQDMLPLQESNKTNVNHTKSKDNV